MLRLLSIRNFVVVEALDLELDAGFTVLTGETGAGKSILLDALGLLLGDRFEVRQLRPGAERAELAAVFEADERPDVADWLATNELASADGPLLLRRTLDAQGRSRAWINGRPATLAQLKDLGERLVDLHGQHAHQSLTAREVQRSLVDAFGGFTALARATADAWRAWNAAVERRDAAAAAALTSAAERETLEARRRELAALAVGPGEWAALTQAQSRLAHAASLIEAALAAEDALTDGDDALSSRLSALIGKLDAHSGHDPALTAIVELLLPARIGIDEAARALRGYRQKLDVDPAELSRIEERLAAIHDLARKHRSRPEALSELLAETQFRLAALAESADEKRLSQRAAEAEAAYRSLAAELSKKRELAAHDLEARVTEVMQTLAMTGGRLKIALEPLDSPASFGVEQVEFRVASHPKQPLGPLAKVASGGELSRIALSIQVVTSEVAEVPTLIFDEVDAGIGGAVAATVGDLLQTLGARRQILCVTHLPQVAACADAHFRVVKDGGADAARADVAALSRGQRIEELARMVAGSEITAKTRAHAKELFLRHRRN
jgi:DNA repair protein RecN (Recombination protein N)